MLIKIDKVKKTGLLLKSFVSFISNAVEIVFWSQIDYTISNKFPINVFRVLKYNKWKMVKLKSPC